MRFRVRVRHERFQEDWWHCGDRLSDWSKRRELARPQGDKCLLDDLVRLFSYDGWRTYLTPWEEGR